MGKEYYAQKAWCTALQGMEMKSPSHFKNEFVQLGRIPKIIKGVTPIYTGTHACIPRFRPWTLRKSLNKSASILNKIACRAKCLLLKMGICVWLRQFLALWTDRPTGCRGVTGCSVWLQRDRVMSMMGKLNNTI